MKYLLISAITIIMICGCTPRQSSDIVYPTTTKTGVVTRVGLVKVFVNDIILETSDAKMISVGDTISYTITEYPGHNWYEITKINNCHLLNSQGRYK